ncbi:MAG TPA: BolA family transcriptional regulator [Candidatus Binatia bacterium]|jgi:stress-induced morphogen|nr:BolA family transcriptional regulator [Candidatus Binatia bacterium]
MSTGIEPITAQEIQSLIRDALPDAQVRVRDFTGGGDHYEAVVVSAAFTGKTKVTRHRMVYGALQEAMVQRIHALALTTLTPEELDQAQEQTPGLVNIQTRNPR